MEASPYLSSTQKSYRSRIQVQLEEVIEDIHIKTLAYNVYHLVGPSFLQVIYCCCYQ